MATCYSEIQKRRRWCFLCYLSRADPYMWLRKQLRVLAVDSLALCLLEVTIQGRLAN